jgi:hypothetical protein
MNLVPAKLALLAASVALAAPLAVHAQQAATTTTAMASAPGKAAVVSTTKASAVIVGIDAALRIVTLKTASGRVVEMVAGPEVRNFDQLKLGEKVKVEYAEALSLELKKGGGGVVSATETGGAARAASGAKPGGGVGRQVTVLADVTAVNAKTQMVTLKGPQGNLVDLHVQDPKQLANIKKGDQIQAVYTEAVAVTVEPADK